MDSTKTITLRAARFFSGTMLSRVTGMLRDISLAFVFGTEPLIALFMVAFRFSHLARRLFGEGSLQNTFIPHFEELRQKNEQEAFCFFRDLSAFIFLILLGGIAFTIPFFLSLFHFDLFSDEMVLILKLTLLMLPSLFFICQFGLNAALLQCEKSYFTPSVAPIAFNLVWIAFSLSLIGKDPLTSTKWLSFGVVIACFAQMAVTVPKALKIIDRAKITNYWKRVNPFSSDVKRLIYPLFLANVGTAASQVNNAIDPLFALYADSEGPAFLWYAIRVQQLPLSLFGVALSGALLPSISRAIKGGDLTRFKEYFKDAEEKLIIALSLMAAFAIVTAPTAINLLYGRGEFGMTSVEGTAKCLMAYAIGLPFMGYVLIGSPALFAFNDFKTGTRAALFTMVLSALLNGIFIFVFGFSAVSVALSTSIAAFVNAIWVKQALIVKVESMSCFKNYSFLFGIIILASFCVIVTDLFLFGFSPIVDLFMQKPLNLSQSVKNEVYHFGVEALIFTLSVIPFLSHFLWRKRNGSEDSFKK